MNSEKVAAASEYSGKASQVSAISESTNRVAYIFFSSSLAIEQRAKSDSSCAKYFRMVLCCDRSKTGAISSPRTGMKYEVIVEGVEVVLSGK